MSREQILARVREALVQKTNPHVRLATQQSSSALPVLAHGPDGRAQAVRQFLPHVGDTFEDHKTAFRALSEKLQTEFICVSNADLARDELKRIAHQNKWKQIGLHDDKLLNSVIHQLDVDRINTSKPYDTRDLEQCDAGVSACDALIAQTASVLITPHSAGGRALSVLPPHHVVIATASQMVTTMADGYDRLREKYGDRWPSFISFITGPSRTADIERVLVLGAHGPKKLTVILIEN